jgi:hypothetical protein
MKLPLPAIAYTVPTPRDFTLSGKDSTINVNIKELESAKLF